jgi:hypothetical protein
LSFPLFVVVVAVDARWVSRALSKQYPNLLAETRTPTMRAQNEAARIVQELERHHWR